MEGHRDVVIGLNERSRCVAVRFDNFGHRTNAWIWPKYSKVFFFCQDKLSWKIEFTIIFWAVWSSKDHSTTLKFLCIFFKQFNIHQPARDNLAVDNHCNTFTKRKRKYLIYPSTVLSLIITHFPITPHPRTKITKLSWISTHPHFRYVINV